MTVIGYCPTCNMSGAHACPDDGGLDTVAEACNEYDTVWDLVYLFFRNRVKTDTWMETPNPLLGGIVPSTLICLRPGKLIKVVRQQLDENKSEPVPAPDLNMPMVWSVRGKNWTPPASGRSFVTMNGGPECAYCQKHISKHFGGTEYRCDLRP
jgi:hypothetical protein